MGKGISHFCFIIGFLERGVGGGFLLSREDVLVSGTFLWVGTFSSVEDVLVSRTFSSKREEEYSN